MPSSSILKDKESRAKLAWLLADFLVVFAGVYAAFLLQQYQDGRQRNRLRQQIFQSLHTEIERKRRTFDEVLTIFDEGQVKAFIDAYEAGERPLPEPLAFRSGTLSGDTWQSMLSRGGLDVLDVDFIYRMERYQNTLRWVNLEFNRLTRRTEMVLLPNADLGEGEFYDAESGALKRKYRWYLESMHTLGASVRAGRDRSQEMLAEIQSRLDSPGTP